MNDMQELRDEVIGILEDATVKAAEKSREAAKVQTRVDSGAYSDDYVQGELLPELARIKRDARDIASIARDEANDAITHYIESAKALEVLNPDDIAEGDYRLLTCGLPLTADDVSAIIDRAESSGNRTMQMLAFRYAEQNGLELGRVYVSAYQEARRAESLREPVHLYTKHWISQPEAVSMLHSLFGIAEN